LKKEAQLCFLEHLVALQGALKAFVDVQMFENNAKESKIVVCKWWGVPLHLSHQKVRFTYKKRFLTFSSTTHEDEWILSSLKTIFKPWQTLSLLIRLV
jgi:hypothetical protein